MKITHKNFEDSFTFSNEYDIYTISLGFQGSYVLFKNGFCMWSLKTKKVAIKRVEKIFNDKACIIND